MSDETSARFGLPFLQPGQAQKELYHNEALARLELAVQASVVAVGVDTPPPTPSLGDCWIVGTSPIGAWAGATRQIAGWTTGGWRFLVPTEGMMVWDAATGTMAHYVAGSWSIGALRCDRVLVGGNQVIGARQPAIADPAGGTTIDGEARGAIAAILSAMRGHGLIAA